MMMLSSEDKSTLLAFNRHFSHRFRAINIITPMRGYLYSINERMFPLYVAFEAKLSKYEGNSSSFYYKTTSSSWASKWISVVWFPLIQKRFWYLFVSCDAPNSSWWLVGPFGNHVACGRCSSLWLLPEWALVVNLEGSHDLWCVLRGEDFFCVVFIYTSWCFLSRPCDVNIQ